MVSDWRLYYAKANYLTIDPFLFTSFFDLVFWKMNVNLGCFQLFNDLTRAQHRPLSDRSLSLCMFRPLFQSSSYRFIKFVYELIFTSFVRFPFPCLYLIQIRVVRFPSSFGDLRSPVHPFPFSLCHSCLAFFVVVKVHMNLALFHVPGIA